MKHFYHIESETKTERVYRQLIDLEGYVKNLNDYIARLDFLNNHETEYSSEIYNDLFNYYKDEIKQILKNIERLIEVLK